MMSRFSHHATALTAGLVLAVGALAPAAPAATQASTAQAPRGSLVFAFHPL